MSEQTTFDNKCNILADLWLNYRSEEEFQDFVEYNDLGLPLSFCISENLVKPGEKAISIVEETFELLLKAVEVEDAGFDSLDDLMLG
jgi:hypothetical protein